MGGSQSGVCCASEVHPWRLLGRCNCAVPHCRGWLFPREGESELLNIPKDDHLIQSVDPQCHARALTHGVAEWPVPGRMHRALVSEPLLASESEGESTCRLIRSVQNRRQCWGRGDRAKGTQALQHNHAQAWQQAFGSIRPPTLRRHHIIAGRPLVTSPVGCCVAGSHEGGRSA